MTPTLDSRWGSTDGKGLTMAQLRRNRRLSWWSIMAYKHDMVTAPEASHGRNEIACHLLPEVFRKPSQVGPVKDRVFPEQLLLFWHQQVVEMKVRLLGKQQWTPMWVNTSSEKVAEKALRTALPEGTEIATISKSGYIMVTPK
jgi:hypothetical protein